MEEHCRESVEEREKGREGWDGMGWFPSSCSVRWRGAKAVWKGGLKEVVEVWGGDSVWVCVWG